VQVEYFDPRRNGQLMKEWLMLTGAEPNWTELAEEAYRFVASSQV
jgi:hypothetical protein